MDLLAFTTGATQGTAKAKPVRPPVYVTEISSDGSTAVRVKKTSESPGEHFKQAGEVKKKTSQLKQRQPQSVNFTIVGNGKDDSVTQHPTTDQAEGANNTERTHQSKSVSFTPREANGNSSFRGHTPLRTPAFISEPANNHDENNNNNNSNPNSTINLAGISVDKGLRTSPLSELPHSRRENESQAAMRDRSPANESNSRKHLAAANTHSHSYSQPQPQGLPNNTGELPLPLPLPLHGAQDDGQSFLDIYIDDEYASLPRKPQFPASTKSFSTLDSIQTDGRKAPMAERITLEGEISRLKAMVMPDFARELFLGRFAMPKAHSCQRGPSPIYLQRLSKIEEARRKQLEQARRMSFGRGMLHGNSEILLRDIGSSLQNDDIYAVHDVLHEMRPGISKRELVCLKHHLLPPLPRDRDMTTSQSDLSYNALSVKPFNPKSADEVVDPTPTVTATAAVSAKSVQRVDFVVSASQLKADETPDLAVGKPEEQQKVMTPKKSNNRRANANMPLWASNAPKRRFSRSLPTDSIIVRRFSKGKLAKSQQPHKSGTIDSDAFEIVADGSRASSLSSHSYASTALMHVHPLTEEQTSVDPTWAEQQHSHGVQNVYQPTVTHSHRSSLAVPNSISRAMAPSDDGSETSLQQTNRSRISMGLKHGNDNRPSKVSTLLRSLLHQLKSYYAQPSQVSSIIMPRNELLTRFRKLDSDSDGHLTFAQLDSSLPALISSGQRQFIKAIYNLVLQSTNFGFEEFSGVHMICTKLESMKNELAKTAFEHLDGIDLESAIEYFLTVFDDLTWSQDTMRSNKSHRAEVVELDKLLKALIANETPQHSFVRSLATIPLRVATNSRERDETDNNLADADQNLADERLRLIRNALREENITSCDQLQFFIMIPLFLLAFKRDKFNQQFFARLAAHLKTS